MKNLVCLIAAGLSLSACTTGINSSVSTDNVQQIVTQYPVEVAMTNLYTQPFSDILHTSITNEEIVLDIKVTPKGSTVFNNESVQSAEVVSSVKTNGQIITELVGVNYFTVDPLVFKGSTDNLGQYWIASQIAEIPKLAKVGESSTYVNETVYSNSTKDDKIATHTQTWSLSQASHNTAWLCIDTSENLLLDNDPNGAASNCYKINPQGDILDSKLTVTYRTESGLRTMDYVSK